MAKALNKDNLAYYDGKVKPFQIKDVEINGNKLKVTKRDGTSKSLDLPAGESGGSYAFTSNRRYTTLYFTEDAVNHLGYADFDEAKAIKYRSNVGLVGCINNIQGESSGTNFVPADNYRNSNKTHPGGIWDVFNDNFGVLNPNIRVNVLEPKRVGYLDDLGVYFFGSKFSDFIVNNYMNSRLRAGLISDNKGIVHYEFNLFGSDGRSKGRVEGYANIGFLVESGISTFFDFGIEREQGVISHCGADYHVNKDLLPKFTEGDSIYMAVYNNQEGISYYGAHFEQASSDVGRHGTLENLRNFVESEDSDGIVAKIYDYDSFQDIIAPIYVDVLPVQIPASYEEYNDWDGNTFNLYAFGIVLFDNADYVKLSGQNIGNGLIIGHEMDYVGVVEGNEESGVTEFTEVYPL